MGRGGRALLQLDLNRRDPLPLSPLFGFLYDRIAEKAPARHTPRSLPRSGCSRRGPRRPESRGSARPAARARDATEPPKVRANSAAVSRAFHAGCAPSFAARAAFMAPRALFVISKRTFVGYAPSTKAAGVLAAQPTISIPAKKKAISRSAVSALSEPCTELASIDSAKSLRMVPGAALAGSVAPITSR